MFVPQIAKAIGVLTSSKGKGARVRFGAWALAPLQADSARYVAVCTSELGRWCGCRVLLQDGRGSGRFGKMSVAVHVLGPGRCWRVLQSAAARCLWQRALWNLHVLAAVVALPANIFPIWQSGV